MTLIYHSALPSKQLHEVIENAGIYPTYDQSFSDGRLYDLNEFGGTGYDVLQLALVPLGGNFEQKYFREALQLSAKGIQSFIALSPQAVKRDKSAPAGSLDVVLNAAQIQIVSTNLDVLPQELDYVRALSEKIKRCELESLS